MLSCRLPSPSSLSPCSDGQASLRTIAPLFFAIAIANQSDGYQLCKVRERGRKERERDGDKPWESHPKGTKDALSIMDMVLMAQSIRAKKQ